MKKEKIFGIIGAVVAVTIISVFFLQMSSTNEINDQEPIIEEEVEEEIQKKYEEIEKAKQKNESFTPAERDWQTSGPFEIDRSQYLLGENIFLRINTLAPNEKGQIAFMRPMNETHYSVYFTIPFDGSEKYTFNQYFKPALSLAKKVCTINDLIGEWAVVFQGTNYENLSFEIIDKFIPGDEEFYEDAC